jgi:hypothetical protein
MGFGDLFMSLSRARYLICENESNADQLRIAPEIEKIEKYH